MLCLQCHDIIWCMSCCSDCVLRMCRHVLRQCHNICTVVVSFLQTLFVVHHHPDFASAMQCVGSDQASSVSTPPITHYGPAHAHLCILCANLSLISTPKCQLHSYEHISVKQLSLLLAHFCVHQHAAVTTMPAYRTPLCCL